MSQTPVSKTALVTGAARRIGKEIALFLARQGWDVALHCHRSMDEAMQLARVIEQEGRRACVLAADLTDPEAASTIVARATQALGPVALLIHNAAGFEKEPFAQFSHRCFASMMAVNLEAPLHISRDFAVQAPAGGQIICLLDGMEGWSMSPAYLSYALSKRGLAEAVRMLARSLAPKLRINGIALGATLEGAYDKEGTFDRLASFAPMQRTGNIEDVLQAVAYLLAAEGITGQIVSIANGMGLPPILAAQT